MSALARALCVQLLLLIEQLDADSPKSGSLTTHCEEREGDRFTRLPWPLRMVFVHYPEAPTRLLRLR